MEEYKRKVFLILAKVYGENAIKSLQEQAMKTYPHLSDENMFAEWLADYVIDSATEIFEEYDIDVN